MTSLKDFAKAYVPKQTKNIADLPSCQVDAEIKTDGLGTDNNGEDFSYNYLELNGEQYRVPNSVIGQIKDLQEENPNMKSFKVKKSGEGLKTRYTVIPLS